MNLLACYLFQGLSPSQLERIAAVTTEQHFKEDHWLFKEEQPATSVYLLKDGAIELVTRVEDGIEIPVTIIRPENGCLGIGALVEPRLYSLSARCLQDSIVLKIEQSELNRLLQDDIELRCTIMTNLAKKMLERLKETRQEVKIHFMNLVRSVSF
jgi:CRP/FNR family transcriptional regulator